MKDPYRHQYSYSGADVRPYAFFPRGELTPLESLHTISFSVHEAKGVVRSLGFRSIRGTTKAVRTIAGSMIFIVINDHPLKGLIEKSYMNDRGGWSFDKYLTGQGTALQNFHFSNRIPALMPPFNLVMNYVAELADWSIVEDRVTFDGLVTMIKGIEFIDEGVVTSVNDVVTEVTYSWIAQDIKPLSRNQFEAHRRQTEVDPNPSEAGKRKQLMDMLGIVNTAFGRDPQWTGTNSNYRDASGTRINPWDGEQMSEEEWRYHGGKPPWVR